MEETINWLDSGIVCAARQERRKEGMPPGMFGSLKLIDKLNFRPDMPEIKAKFRTELDHHLYWSHRGFSDNPLLLTIMLMTFEEFAEIPSKMHIFYQEAYTVLSKKHDASKGGFRRALKTGVSTDQFADMFARFCGITYKDEKFEFSWTEMDRYFRDLQKRFHVESKATDDFIYDACSNLCIMYLEGGRYSFIHRSFQEYFCARYFARQKDKHLEQIGRLFEHNRLARPSDQTFQMLYDMIPEKITEFIIIPYLRDLLENCDAKDGYHTFLQEIYGSVDMGDDYVIDKGCCSPNSMLYSFIIQQFSICHEREIDASLVEDIHLLPFTTYYILNETENYDIVEENNIPYDYEEEYGIPDEAGNVYTLNWDELFANPKKYHSLLCSIDCEGFPLMLEYKDIRRLYKDLLESITHSDDEDLFEILD